MPWRQTKARREDNRRLSIGCCRPLSFFSGAKRSTDADWMRRSISSLTLMEDNLTRSQVAEPDLWSWKEKKIYCFWLAGYFRGFWGRKWVRQPGGNVVAEPNLWSWTKKITFFDWEVIFAVFRGEMGSATWW